MASIKENYSLETITTFRTGGPIRFFAEVSNIEEVQMALRFVAEKNIPLRILGSGSNILAGETLFDGMVIQVALKGLEVRELPLGQGSTNLESVFEVSVGAGESWDDFVSFTVMQGMYGLENLSLIPGTVGAAPVQNIGAYGAEAKDTIAYVEGIDIASGSTQRFLKDECQFGYRTSIFKEKLRGKFIISKVGFHLKKTGRVSIGYKDLSEYFGAHFSANLKPKEVRDAVVSIRKSKLPNLNEVGTAGSFFKNPVISRAKYDELLTQYPGMPGFVEKASPDGLQEKDTMKVPLGWILDKVCNMRGVREGNVGTWQGQALVLVNYGGAKGGDVRAFADRITKTVKEKTGIDIEWEVEWWG